MILNLNYQLLLFMFLMASEYCQNLAYEAQAIHLRLEMLSIFLFLIKLITIYYYMFFITLLLLLVICLLNKLYIILKLSSHVQKIILIEFYIQQQMNNITSKDCSKLSFHQKRKKCSILIGELFKPNPIKRQIQKINLKGFQKKTSKSFFKKAKIQTDSNQMVKKSNVLQIGQREYKFQGQFQNQQFQRSQETPFKLKKHRKTFSVSNVDKKVNFRHKSQLKLGNTHNIGSNSIHVTKKSYPKENLFIKNIKKIRLLIKRTQVDQNQPTNVNFNRKKLLLELQNISRKFQKNYSNLIHEIKWKINK